MDALDAKELVALREVVINECVGVVRGIAIAYGSLPADSTLTVEEVIEALNAGADKLPEAFRKRWAENEAQEVPRG
jgi:hypothetical protein